MKVFENGVYREMTPEEIVEFNSMMVEPDYKESVISAIREKYSIDDELAILRQRDTKPGEFEEYFNFVEKIKLKMKE